MRICVFRLLLLSATSRIIRWSCLIFEFYFLQLCSVPLVQATPTLLSFSSSVPNHHSPFQRYLAIKLIDPPESVYYLDFHKSICTRPSPPRTFHSRHPLTHSTEMMAHGSWTRNQKLVVLFGVFSFLFLSTAVVLAVTSVIWKMQETSSTSANGGLGDHTLRTITLGDGVDLTGELLLHSSSFLNPTV